MFDLYARPLFRQLGDAEFPCYLCGRQVRSPKWGIHVHGGGQFAVTEEEAKTMDESADLGCYPIGTECAKLIPKEYRFKWIEGVGLVAQETVRRCIGIELNPDYIEIARKRLSGLT